MFKKIKSVVIILQIIGNFKVGNLTLSRFHGHIINAMPTVSGGTNWNHNTVVEIWKKVGRALTWKNVWPVY